MYRIVVACLFAIPLLAAPAAAQDEATEKAKQLFIEGSKHFEAGRLGQALKAFQEANTIKPHPLMLYNIAQTFQEMEDLPRAIDNWKKYLATGPDDAGAIRDRIAQLEQRLATFAQVKLVTRPAGAKVWLNSQDRPPQGETPLTLPVPPGRRTLIFEAPGYRRVERPIRVREKEQLTVDVVLPEVLPVVTVKTTPEGARLAFDEGEVRGVSPMSEALKKGEHRVRIEKEGFEPVTRSFTLAASHTAAQPLVIDVTLEKAVPKGQLIVEIEPDGAEVRVDDEVVGTSPLQAPLTLAKGLHRLTVTHPAGGEPHTEMVAIEPGQVHRTEIELDVDVGDEGPGISGRTWGWIVMGVGGAALLGGGVAAGMAFGSSGDLDDCRADDTCARTQREADLADEVRTRALAGDILIGTGAAIAAGGLVLYLLSDDPAEAGQDGAVYVTPLAEGGVAAMGRFAF